MTDNTPAPVPLQWELLIKRRGSATQGIPPGKEALAWVANTVTLICGERNAVLVDTFLGSEHTRELIDWIEGHDRHLDTIYVTHGHADHFFGLTLLLEHFPDVRAIAPRSVVDKMKRMIAEEELDGRWSRMFRVQVPDRLTAARVMAGDTFELEGRELRAVALGHTDTDDTTALYVPSIGLVVSGDAVYNGTHPYLGESDAQGRRAWLAALDTIAALEPRAVVAGHGVPDPDCSPRHIAATRQYLLDFERTHHETATARELYDRMLERYPDWINPGSLWGGAHAAKRAG